VAHDDGVVRQLLEKALLGVSLEVEVQLCGGSVQAWRAAAAGVRTDCTDDAKSSSSSAVCASMLRTMAGAPSNGALRAMR
jgi:hypothetical protein